MNSFDDETSPVLQSKDEQKQTSSFDKEEDDEFHSVSSDTEQQTSNQVEPENKADSGTAEGEISTQSENPTIKIRKESSLRKMIAYAITRIENGDQVTVMAYGKNLPRAITLVAIVKERVGHVNQITSLVQASSEDEEGRGGRITPGIQIIISRGQLDTSDPGYQRAKPRGCESFYYISK